MSSSEAHRIQIGAWQTAGMSLTPNNLEQGLNIKTFGNWVRKHRADQVMWRAVLVSDNDQADTCTGEYGASPRKG